MLTGFGMPEFGVNTAVRVAGVNTTVPGIAAPVPVTFRLMVDVLIVAGSIGSLNTTVIVADADTPVAPVTGAWDVTVGGVRSRVITVAASDSGDASEITPDVQLAETEYLYVCCCASPVSVNEVVVDSPTLVPLRIML
jgi:hypothetical protein